MTFSGRLAHNSPPQVTAHRGDGDRFTENTVAAVVGALELGVDRVEIDVRMTLDGHVVVIHDPNLWRVFGPHGGVGGQLRRARSATLGKTAFAGDSVRRLRLDQVKQRTAGSVPLLAELLAEVPADRLLIDMDHAAPALAAWAVAAQFGDGRPSWCGNVDAMRCLRRHDPAAQIWMPWSRPEPPTSVELDELRPTFVNVPHKIATTEFVASLAAGGYPVSAWTADDPALIGALWARGVRSVTTNHPAAALALRDRP